MEHLPGYIAKLAVQVLKGEASEVEREEFERWLAEDIDNASWFKKIVREGYVSDTLNEVVQAKEVTARILKNRGIDVEEKRDLTESVLGKVSHISKTSLKYAAAIVFLMAVGYGVYFFNNKNKLKPLITAQKTDDVTAPQLNRAMITLEDGSTVYLDSVKNGQSIQTGNIKLIKLDNGQIAYRTSDGKIVEKQQYHTLINPRGSKVIDLQLSDGSRVWLNAGSSIKYPVVFIEQERRVEIKGEGYFEVAPNAARPFIVSKDGIAVRVLGTHFNVNAFEDEGDGVKITLLEGAIKVNKGHTNVVLKPGQQATVNNAISVANNVDIEFVMAWKNGYFNFNKASLQNVLMQLSRWYDVEVIYEGANRPRKFDGEIQKDLKLLEVLKILEKNNLRFRIEGRKLFVDAD